MDGGCQTPGSEACPCRGEVWVEQPSHDNLWEMHLPNCAMAALVRCQPCAEDVTAEVQGLVLRWRVATFGESFPRIKHRWAQAVVAFGQEAVRPLLLLLERNVAPYETMMLLGHLVGHRPYPPDALGRVPVMRDHWLGWGRRQGLLP